MKQKLREWAFRALYTLACKLSSSTVWLFGCCYAWFPEYMMFADSDEIPEEVEIWDDADYEEDQADMFAAWEENEAQHHVLYRRMDEILEGKDEPDAQKRTHLPM